MPEDPANRAQRSGATISVTFCDFNKNHKNSSICATLENLAALISTMFFITFEACNPMPFVHGIHISVM